MGDGVDRHRRIVFLGPPNSGKGTQAARLAARLGVPSISTGDMLRAAVAAGSELGRRVEGVLAAGKLVGDDLMAELVRERLGREDARHGFILDGYPRTAGQATTLRELLSGEEPDAVLFVDADEDVLVRRGLGRGRVDDDERVLRERLRVYRRETAGLVEHYGKIGVLRSIDGQQSVEAVARDIESALGERGA